MTSSAPEVAFRQSLTRLRRFSLLRTHYAGLIGREQQGPKAWQIWLFLHTRAYARHAAHMAIHRLLAWPQASQSFETPPSESGTDTDPITTLPPNVEFYEGPVLINDPLFQTMLDAFQAWYGGIKADQLLAETHFNRFPTLLMEHIRQMHIGRRADELLQLGQPPNPPWAESLIDEDRIEDLYDLLRERTEIRLVAIELKGLKPDEDQQLRGDLIREALQVAIRPGTPAGQSDQAIRDLVLLHPLGHQLRLNYEERFFAHPKPAKHPEAFVKAVAQFQEGTQIGKDLLAKSELVWAGQNSRTPAREDLMGWI